MSAAAVTSIALGLRHERATMHDRVLADRTLPDSAKTAYTVVLRMCYSTGEGSASLEWLAERAGMPLIRFRRSVAALKGKYLWWKRTGRTNIWSIVSAQNEQSDCSPVEQSLNKEVENSLDTKTAAAFRTTSCVAPKKPPADAAQDLPPETPIEPNPLVSRETEVVRGELKFLEAEDFLTQWPLAKLKEGIAYTHRAIQRGIRSGNPIDNPPGFLRRALEKGLRIAEVVPIATPSPPSTLPPDCDKCMDTGFAGLDCCDCDMGTRAQRREELRGPIDHELHLGKMDCRQHKAELSRVFAEAGL